MAGMPNRSPTSKFTQAVIAFLSAAVSAVLVFAWVNKSRFELYARQYPHDGQDGLSAFMEALQAGFWTLLGVFIFVFIAQCMLTGDSNPPDS